MTPQANATTIETACEKTVEWLMRRVELDARGDKFTTLSVEPSGRFWMGRLAAEQAVVNSGFGDRSERMEPCAVGMRLKPKPNHPWRFDVSVSLCAWTRDDSQADRSWQKSSRLTGSISLLIDDISPDVRIAPLTDLERALAAAVGADELRVSVRVECERGRDGHPEFVVSVVNESPDREHAMTLKDTNLYEVSMQVSGLETCPFLLEALPDSFRFDRRIAAYGINCGVELLAPNVFQTTDIVTTDRCRPAYWAGLNAEPDLRFVTLASDSLPQLNALVTAHQKWGTSVWADNALDQRAREEHWSAGMRQQAAQAAAEFLEEQRRMANGVRLLESNQQLRRAFHLMNEAMKVAAYGKYEGWRPFQIGFLLANAASVLGTSDETEVADILWFATGGGKTETYLGLLVMAAFHDRLTGKSSGITAWSRFPLRLLSLQQTQRFADAMAGAEIVRRKHHIDGDPFSLGFFVGEGATPNAIPLEPKETDPDVDDDSMPDRFQVLLNCPFCRRPAQMGFDRKTWRLEHRCGHSECPWPEAALPFYIVDQEIYRFLPTVVVGTLDKVATVSMQAAMRGFVSSPYGLCSAKNHGYTYAPRSTRPSGCLVPGCRGHRTDLPMNAKRYPPTFRLQDELHLLRDSLGAIDSHYECLMDHLAVETCSVRAKIVASSATLTGYERQCDVLYRRRGRVFPAQGPRANESFWSTETPNLLRRFVALAPRGATLEFAADRILTVLQQAVREMRDDPVGTCGEIGVDVEFAAQLLSLYGTDVVYGNTIRDLDASVRSLETQVPVKGPLHTAQLTGHTPFSEVRQTLDRLQTPEPAFDERIHVIAASSMMSHGVDVDRLNVMVMLGLPLATSEFIQATARIGRRRPGLVFVLHKMALERDASLFRAFQPFVEQGDRFVDAIPVTKRSSRVLERTMPGLMLARVRHLFEPTSGKSLWTPNQLRQFCRTSSLDAQSQIAAFIELLEADSSLDEPLRTTMSSWLEEYFRRLLDPAFPSETADDLSPSGAPMRSLRDVEEQAPIHD